jgi:hypothetical protein
MSCHGRVITPLPTPWRADKTAGGYVVRDATEQALAYLYAREKEDEARQVKVLTPTRRGASLSISRGCRSCLGRGASGSSRPWVKFLTKRL